MNSHPDGGWSLRRRSRPKLASVGILTLVVAFGADVTRAQTAEPIKIGGMCDRTGSTRVIGIELCPGVADYIALINRKGGLLGHKLEYTEIDHSYVVPRAVEAYQQLKRDGAVTFFTYGVPTLQGLAQYYMRDKLPPFNSGTGRGEYIDGTVWPYIFPGTAQYWSQAGAVMKYLKDSGAKKGTKIAYLYLDSPAGREGIAMVEVVAASEGYELRKYAVQPPGLEMEPHVTAIVRDFKADWVITSLFGRPPAVSIREFRKAGFPLNHVISFVYGAGDPDVEEAGWDAAQGYLGVQYASVGRDFPVIQEILKMYRDGGKEAPKYVGGAYYNRGVLTGAIILEGIRLAIQNHGLPLTGDNVRRGYESISKLDLQGLGPPLHITPQDHEGGGYLRIYQVKGSAWVPVTDWVRGYHDEVMALVKKANAK
ncbi:MAG TPA: ABC transporter substrate-binding protein [Vicinamibacterales bacterium]|nr:ABC transporter substrate-binding protein [Vicinamibacterales bacterium]